jgi:hypothetical protein
VQDAQQHQGGGLGQVQGLRGRLQDGSWFPHVTMHVLSGAVRAAGQQGPGVGQHDGVVVGVHDPRVGRDRLGDLVCIVR